MKDIELLAPVGSMKSLYAAVQNGANAVYLGGKLFNARQYASNFENDELEEAVRYAHLRGVRVYVTVNILIDNAEIEDVIDYVRFLYETDVDAVIVQDIGLANLIREFFPKLQIHASTQMTINNLYGAELLYDMGFSRVVLARETPLDEIKHISENTPIELEAFIHGALCISYSGQCLMSSMIGGRSGNRGNCAQPCRMPSSLVDRDGKLFYGWDKKHLLSTRDLNTIGELDKIVDAGIISLKIEGRMKRPEYVATIVKNYRKALDQGVASIDKKNIEDMTQVFNREFTKGAMLGSFGEDFVSIERPDNRGLFIGKVARADKYKVYVELEKDISIGDGIEFKLSTGESKGLKSTIDASQGEIAMFEKPGYILNNSPVYKTSSEQLLKRAKKSYQDENIIYKIDAEIEIIIGGAPRLSLKYADKQVHVLGEKITEKAKKTGLTKEIVIEQLSKLGDTNYSLNNIKINLEENSFLPLSAINKLRRDATDKMDSLIQIDNSREKIENENYNKMKNKIFKAKRKNPRNKKEISIKLNSIDQLNQLNLDKLDRLYLNYEEELRESIEMIKPYKKEIYLSTEKILYEDGIQDLEKRIKDIESDLDGISVSNLGTFKYIRDRFDLKIHGDMGLNIFNSYSIDFLKSKGIKSLNLSPELTLEQIRKIREKSETSAEAIVYGRLPVMTMVHCPMSLVRGCKDDSDCENCNFRSGYRIKDRMNIEFPMERRASSTTIYNSVPIMVLDNLESIYSSGVDMARLDFTTEKNDIRYIQEAFYDFSRGNIDIEKAREIISDYRIDHDITNGHYFRGIM